MDRKGGQKQNKGPYQIASKSIKKKILILCEGEVTEPLYFKTIAGQNVNVDALGFGATTLALLKKAEKYCIKNNVDQSKVEIWLVFDFDVEHNQLPRQKQDYNAAIKRGREIGFKIAYSNDCFELWLLLHFKPLNAQQTRYQYFSSLDKLLDLKYEEVAKNEKKFMDFLPTLITHPKMDKVAAMKRAHRLLEEKKELTFADQNPVTTVFQLANQVNPDYFPLLS